MTDPSGPEVVPVSPSHPQVNSADLMTNDISGQRGTVLSVPVRPPLSTENKSPARQLSEKLAVSLEAAWHRQTSGRGSTMFKMTLKHHITPSGLLLLRVAASVPRTSGKGSTSWPSPHANSSNGAGHSGREGSPNIQTVAQQAAWTTPQAHDRSPRGSGQKQKHGTKHGCADLNADAASAAWVTPSARDWKDTDGMSSTGSDPDGSKRTRVDQLPRQAYHLAGWPTTGVSNHGKGESPEAKVARGANSGLDLAHASRLSGWDTTQAQDWKWRYSTPDAALRRLAKGKQMMLEGQAFLQGPVRLTVGGEIVTGSGAGMNGGGQLNPALSRWLMGLPIAWDQAAIRAHRTVTRRRKGGSRASKATVTQ